jgi:hypothetical protein
MEKQPSKKTIVIIIIAFLLVALLIFIAIFLKKPKQTNTTTPPISINNVPTPNIETPEGITSQNLGKLSFSFKNQSTPKTGTLYSSKPQQLSQALISNFQNSLLPNSVSRKITTPQGDVIMNTDNSGSLIFYLYSGTVEYDSTSQASSGNLSSESLQEGAINTLSRLSIPHQNNPDILPYISEGGETSPANDFSSSNVIDFSFPEILDNQIVFQQLGSSAQTHVWLDKSGQLIKLTYRESYSYSPTAKTSLMSLDEAKNSLLQGKGEIVSYGNDYHSLPEKPSETNISSFKMGLFNDFKNQLLYPVFVFEGTASNSKGSYPITIYLPAQK